MPTKREREYYAMGYRDGTRAIGGPYAFGGEPELPFEELATGQYMGLSSPKRKPKRKLSAWNKFVKANSRKKEFRYRDGKLNLKKMGVAFRRKKRR